VLLYDGECGLCAASVQFVLRHERARTLKFAPLQGRFAEAVRARHRALESLDSMVWVEPTHDGAERLYVRSEAALKAAAYLGGAWRLALIGRLVPRALRDTVYDWVARHRHTAFAPPSCLVPSPDDRQRFIE
jgi:predicted DCC family thiol-disulfide oxidoreductase YuxK